MMMNDLLLPLLAALGGAALGTVFYGGLYWTVRLGMRSATPALWFSVSMLLRTGVVLAGFYAIGGGDWHRLVACVPAFLLARAAVTRWGCRSVIPGETLKAAEAP
jgi:F1F0 ATPase subunit 2